MSIKYKRRNALVLSACYDRWPDTGCCYYCNAPAPTWDHVVPASEVWRRRELGIPLRGIPLVPACQECNSLLGSRPIYTLTERKAYIKKCLRQRNWQLLRSSDWAEEEKDEIGPLLRMAIQKKERKKQIVRERLRA